MRVLDLFSGLGGWSAAFRDRGHEVATIDLDYRLSPTYCRDIGGLESLSEFGRFDVMLASPPCEKFSIASAYLHNFRVEGGQLVALTSGARHALELVEHTFSLIQDANPTYWVVENPVGFMRHRFRNYITIDQCQYGRNIKKPTDLWGVIPESFAVKRCAARTRHLAWWKSAAENKEVGDCHHIKSAKGADGWNHAGTRKDGVGSRQHLGGTRGPAERAQIPYGLSLAMCKACERDSQEFAGSNPIKAVIS